MHPVSPFITEELWRVTGAAETGREKPLVHGDWPILRGGRGWRMRRRMRRWAGWSRSLRTIRSVRAELNVAPSAEVPLVMTDLSAAARARLQRNEALIRRLSRLSGWSEEDAAPKGAVAIPLDGATANLGLAEFIDAPKEIARLEKAVAKVEKEAAGIRSKLSNEKFLAKAPEDVVEEQKERLETAEGEAHRLGAALTRVREMG